MRATRGRRPVRATTEWGLPTASMPVSASKTSLERFSQASSSTAASRNRPSWSQRGSSLWLMSQPALSSAGITATEYIGHLIAAFQSA